MRFIIIPIGVAGSGKSTFINNSELKHHALSRDTIKEMFFGTTIENNNLTRARYSNDKTHTMTNTKKIYNSALRNRMSKGDFIVLDETNCFIDNFKNLLHLIKAYQYTPIFLSFDISIEEAKERNNNRKNTIRYVPENVIEAMFSGKLDVINYIKKQKYDILNASDFVNGDTFLHYIDVEYRAIYENNLLFNEYDKIYCIGDIQGCYDKLKEFMDEHYNQDNFYIFTGDYTDRGDKNKDTLQYLMKLSKNTNVSFIVGNHETYVWQYLSGQKSNHGQFENITKEEIKSLDKNLLKKFYSKCVDYIRINRKDKSYMICHGGVKDIPTCRGIQIPSDYFWRGQGEYEDNTAMTLQNDDIVVIHGHRNKHNNPIQVKNVINLEQKIEKGGNIGYYIID